MFTPETSKLFTEYIDPVSGVKTYVLTEHLNLVQKAFYFVNKSCSEDGRYMWITHVDPETDKQSYGLIDFETDTLTARPDVTGGGAWVDIKTGNLYAGTAEGIEMFTPNTADGSKIIVPMPAFAKEANIKGFGTHITPTADGKEFVADFQVPGVGSVIGSLSVETGAFTEWYRTKPGVPYNHVQGSPLDPDLLMCAHEYSYNSETGKFSPPPMVDGIYPRLQLIRRDGSREMRKAYGNYATHELWAPDGQSILYCAIVGWNDGDCNGSQGQHVVARDRLGDAEPEVICCLPIENGCGAWHTSCTQDQKYFVLDGSLPTDGLSWWRGIRSTCRFFNTETGKFVNIISENPVVNGYSPDNQCKYHIDPHPCFVMNDGYITHTVTVYGKVTAALTPVDQLIALTK